MGDQLDMFPIVLPALPSKEHLARLYQDLHLARSRAHVQRLSRHESTKRYEAKDRARIAFDKAVDMYPAADRKRVRAACKDEHACESAKGFLCEHARAAQAEVDASPPSPAPVATAPERRDSDCDDDGGGMTRPESCEAAKR